MPQAYCVVDKKMVEMVDPTPRTTKNGRKQLVGKCPHCQRDVYRFVSMTNNEVSGQAAKRRVPKQMGRGLYF